MYWPSCHPFVCFFFSLSPSPAHRYVATRVTQQDNNLVSGPLDALLQHLVPTAEYYPDRTYIFAFLLSSRLYIKPHALLAQVVRLCMLQQNLADQKLTKVRLPAHTFPLRQIILTLCLVIYAGKVGPFLSAHGPAPVRMDGDVPLRFPRRASHATRPSTDAALRRS